MKIPPNHREDEVLAIIEKVVNQLAPTFTFGIWDLDDIKQFGRLKALELLEHKLHLYDPARPLEAWIYSGVKNRYINLRRDKLTRCDPPCRKCASGTPCTDHGPCQKYEAWRKRNASKANIQRPMDLDHVAEEGEESDVAVQATIRESLQLIDAKLPIELRQTYLQMRHGVSVPKSKRLLVEQAVKEILQGDIECPSEDD